MKKVIDKVLYILFLFTLFIIIIVHSSYYKVDIYGGGVLGIIFMILSIIYLIANKKPIVYSDILDLCIVYLIIIYSILSVYNGYHQDKSKIFYAMFSVLPMIVFISLNKYLRYTDLKIKKIITRIFIISAVLALIMFICGYSKISYSIKQFIILMPNSQYIIRYGESRLMWVCSHKSRFATFCILGIWFLTNDKDISKSKKTMFLIIFIIDICLSGSKTALLCGIFIVFSLLKKYIHNINVLIKAPLIIIIFVVLLGSLNIYKDNLGQTRDIGNLGLRSFIWQSGIELSNYYPKGIVKFDEQFYLTNNNTGNIKFTNAHNVFLNQIIEKGKIAGYMYIGIFILILLRFTRYKKYHDIVCFMCIVLLSCIDYTITSEINYIFWYCLSILYCDVRNNQPRKIVN